MTLTEAASDVLSKEVWSGLPRALNAKIKLKIGHVVIDSPKLCLEDLRYDRDIERTLNGVLDFFSKQITDNEITHVDSAEMIQHERPYGPDASIFFIRIHCSK